MNGFATSTADRTRITVNDKTSDQKEAAVLERGGALGVRKRLFWVFGAQSAAILLRIVQQIILVPVLIRYWGPALYQDWIIVFSATSSLAILDLGMQIYFGNAMLLAWSRQDLRAYRRYFATVMGLYAVVLGVAATLLVGTTAVFSWPMLLGIRAIAASSVLWIAGILALASFILIPFGVVMSVYRAHGDYGRGTGIAVIAEALRGFGICTVAILGGSLEAAAWIYLIVAVVFWIGVALDQRHLYGDLSFSLALPNASELREAALRSSLYLAPTLTTPAVMNGPILLLGLLGALPGSVVAFTVSRTFAGFARQLVLQFCHPIGSELARQQAIGEQQRLQRLYSGAGRMVTGMAGLLGGLVMVAGAPFIHIWTHGEVAFNPSLVGAFVAATILTAPAQVAQMLFTYNNRPGVLVAAQIGFAIGTLALCLLLIPYFSASGAAWAATVAECLSLGLILPRAAARQVGLLVVRYFWTAYLAGGAAFALSYAVAKCLDRAISANSLLTLLILGMIWSAIMAAPSFFLLLASDERRWLLQQRLGPRWRH